MADAAISAAQIAVKLIIEIRRRLALNLANLEDARDLSAALEELSNQLSRLNPKQELQCKDQIERFQVICKRSLEYITELNERENAKKGLAKRLAGKFTNRFGADGIRAKLQELREAVGNTLQYLNIAFSVSTVNNSEETLKQLQELKEQLTSLAVATTSSSSMVSSLFMPAAFAEGMMSPTVNANAGLMSPRAGVGGGGGGGGPGYPPPYGYGYPPGYGYPYPPPPYGPGPAGYPSMRGMPMGMDPEMGMRGGMGGAGAMPSSMSPDGTMYQPPSLGMNGFGQNGEVVGGGGAVIANPLNQTAGGAMGADGLPVPGSPPAGINMNGTSMSDAGSATPDAIGGGGAGAGTGLPRDSTHMHHPLTHFDSRWLAPTAQNIFRGGSDGIPDHGFVIEESPRGFFHFLSEWFRRFLEVFSTVGAHQFIYSSFLGALALIDTAASSRIALAAGIPLLAVALVAVTWLFTPKNAFVGKSKSEIWQSRFNATVIVYILYALPPLIGLNFENLMGGISDTTSAYNSYMAAAVSTIFVMSSLQALKTTFQNCK